MQIRRPKPVSRVNWTLSSLHAALVSLLLFSSILNLPLSSLLQCRSAHSSPTWPGPPWHHTSPPFCHPLASISFSAASHEARWVTAPHARSYIHTVTQFKRGPRNPSVILPPTDRFCSNLEVLSNVMLACEARNGNEGEKEPFAH